VPHLRRVSWAPIVFPPDHLVLAKSFVSSCLLSPKYSSSSRAAFLRDYEFSMVSSVGRAVFFALAWISPSESRFSPEVKPHQHQADGASLSSHGESLDGLSSGFGGVYLPIVAGTKPFIRYQDPPLSLVKRECFANGTNYCFGNNANYCQGCGASCCSDDTSKWCCAGSCCGGGCCASGATCKDGQCQLPPYVVPTS